MFGLFDYLFGNNDKGPFDGMEGEETAAFFLNILDGDEDEDRYYDDDEEDEDLFDD